MKPDRCKRDFFVGKIFSAGMKAALLRRFA
nr:MAG TPA: hypothetical protein [Bacteriophage sp.]